jgi:4,5-dihydroxyphthalate decarboxylase
MPDFPLTLACRNYDRTSAILTGDVTVPGVELRTVEMTDVAALFTGLHTGEFDVSEMSLGELVYAISRGWDDFIAIPVFPYRMFRHGYMFRGPGVDGPDDVSGKRVALPRVVQTAGIWMRGLLTEHHGVSPAATEWYYGSLHHWESGRPDEGMEPNDGSVHRLLDAPSSGAHAAIEQSLLDGTVDVLCTTRVPASASATGPVQWLFDRYPEAEADYYRATGIYPIMHAIAIRKEAIEGDADLPVRLFQAFVEAKRLSNQRLFADASLSLVWKDHYVETERTLFGGDPWEYGIAKNRHVVEKFLAYCYEQGVAAREMQVEELFAPGTHELAE